jgi:hypothetical protein
MIIPTTTISNILSGSFNFSSGNYKALISSASYNSSYRTVDQIPSVVYISDPIQNFNSYIESGSYAFSRSAGVSASPVTFTGSTVPSPTYTLVTLYVYEDTGNTSTDKIIAYRIFSSISLLNPVYTFASNVLFRMQDNNSSTFIYRKARKKLLDGQFGNLETIPLKLALLNSYTPNIETDEFWTTISPTFSTTVNIINQTVVNRSLVSSEPYVIGPSLVGTFNRAILYIDNTSELIATYNISPSINMNNNVLGLRFTNDAIFTI